jgi:hypothetical protein
MVLSRIPRIGIDASPEFVQVMKFLMNRPHLCGDFLERSDDHQRRRIVLHIDLLTRGDLVQVLVRRCERLSRSSPQSPFQGLR